jgi:hypothetical protein
LLLALLLLLLTSHLLLLLLLLLLEAWDLYGLVCRCFLSSHWLGLGWDVQQLPYLISRHV